MTPENFVYWLQGFLELSHQTSLDETQTKMIRDHLNLVFEKKTPTYFFNVSNESNSIPLDLSHTHIPVTC